MAAGVVRQKHVKSEFQENLEAFWQDEMAHICCDPKTGEMIWDEKSVTHLGYRAVQVIAYMAYVKGDLKAAMWLADRSLAGPEVSFQMKVSNMSLNEAREALYQLARGADLSHDVTEGLIRVAERAEIKCLTGGSE